MSDIRVEKLADLLVNYSVEVKPGDKVVIQGETGGEPLLCGSGSCWADSSSKP